MRTLMDYRDKQHRKECFITDGLENYGRLIAIYVKMVSPGDAYL